MCGAFISFTPEQLDEIRDMVNLAEERARFAEAGALGGVVRPTDKAIVLVPDNKGGLEPRAMTFGFKGWSTKRKDGKGWTKPNTPFNTRSEDALGSDFWRDSLLKRRIIVPSSGFIEWRRKDKKDKTKYLFKTPGERDVYLAGIYETVETEEGNTEERFSIVTTDANPYINEIHDRMPVVLLRKEFAEWLYSGDYTRLFDRCALRLDKSLYNGPTTKGPVQLDMFGN